MPWIGCDCRQGFGGDVEDQPVNHRLVRVGKRADRFGQGEYDVVILDGQEIGHAGIEPALCGPGLALRAMTVAAGVVADFKVVAGVALQRMSPQRHGAALFDGRHDLQLREIQVPI